MSKNMATLLWFSICLCITFVSCANSVRCPAKCQCSWIMGSLDVDCSQQALFDYPSVDNLPVESLILAYNQFTYFPKHFADISTLTLLDLSHNKIAYIEPDSFLGFTNLRVLYLDNNTIQSWEDISAHEAFLEALNLEHLSLNDNQLGFFDDTRPSAILNSNSLKKLELQRCGITRIGGTVLMDGLPNLKHLQLSGNPIINLALLPSQSLIEIQLAKCELKAFTHQFLLNLPNLKYLNLSSNFGLQFDDQYTLVSDILTKLDLSFCQPNILDFKQLPKLSFLSLSGNMLRTIHSDMFINNLDLEIIDLSHNLLAQIEPDVFRGLHRLTKIDFSYNELAKIDRNLFSTNDKLSMINLSHNVLGTFTAINSKSLRDIHAGWNEIINIDSDIFSSSPALQKLDLSNNLLKEFPAGLQSLHLQKLDLANCRITGLRNNTFRGFPKLTTLRLNGNRLTNSLPADFFQYNPLLSDILLGDNPWTCNCNDHTFEKFYSYLTVSPPRIKDPNNLRCASPPTIYGKLWATACSQMWLSVDNRKERSQDAFAVIMYIFLFVTVFLVMFICLRRFLKIRKERRNEREYNSNVEEMNEIRRLNQRILREESAPNAPNSLDLALPSYEAAIMMPKNERPVKSMLDLRASKRKFWQRNRAESEEEPELDLMLNRIHRSEEMLSNRDRERTLPMGTFRRTGYVTHNNSGSRRFSIEDSRFPSSNVKNQNLQSAEQIGNFQSYENSPYTKRKPKIAQIPPFKRATFKSQSVEFLTDPEFEEVHSRPASPFAQRKPKSPVLQELSQTPLSPPVENYFGSNIKKQQYGSSDSSSFHVVIQPEVGSSAGDLSAMSPDLERNKRKKRKNSNRRLSGNMSAAAAEAESSASEHEPMIVVHKPIRETIF